MLTEPPMYLKPVCTSFNLFRATIKVRLDSCLSLLLEWTTLTAPKWLLILKKSQLVYRRGSFTSGSKHSSPTFPPYVGKKLTALFHTQPPLTSHFYSIAAQMVNCVFQLNPSPVLQAPGHCHQLGLAYDLGLPNEYTLGHSGSSAASRHKLASISRQYSLLTATDTTALY